MCKLDFSGFPEPLIALGDCNRSSKLAKIMIFLPNHAKWVICKENHDFALNSTTSMVDSDP